MENYRCEISDMKEIRQLTDSTLSELGEQEEIFKIKLSEHMKSVLNVEQNYSVLRSTREDWQKSNYLFKNYDLVWFTDGSKTTKGIGLGIYSSTCSNYISLGKNMTVFQAEILVITGCSELLIEQDLVGHKILICSDSLSALNSFKKDKINSRLVGDCCKTLNELGRNNEVVLTWVPGQDMLELMVMKKLTN